MMFKEAKWAAVAFVLSPLSLAISVPVLGAMREIFIGEAPDSLLPSIGEAPLLVWVGLVGFAVFGIPLYLVLRWLRWSRLVGIAAASATGIFAALTTPKILFGMWMLWDDFAALVPALSGALAGIVFWYLTRRGFPPAESADVATRQAVEPASRAIQ